MKIPAVVLLIFTASLPAMAHRLDEYLQATIITINKDHVEAELTLTPGVAVLPSVLGAITSETNGDISEAHRDEYVSRVIRDLFLSVDGQPLALHLRSARFPRIKEMRDGLGEIRIRVNASLPPGGRKRKLIFENWHESRLAAYQVNCLVPQNPKITITAQRRSYFQSHYEVDYTDAEAGPDSFVSTLLDSASTPFATVMYLAFGWMVLIWTQRSSRNSRLRNVTSS